MRQLFYKGGNMMKTSKKLLSLLLAALMVLSSMSAGIYAYAQSQPKIYEGLDESYQALAQALVKDYVSKAAYSEGERSVTVTDNENRDVYGVFKAFYDIFSQMDYTSSPPKNQSNLVNFANSISETLSNAMGNDYTDFMEKIVTKYCNGLGSSSNANSSGEYTVTVLFTQETYLLEFDKVSDLPESIPSSARFTYKVKTGGSWLFGYNYPCESISQNDSFTSDTESSANIKNYDAVFSQKVLDTPFEDLDKDVFTNIEKNGQSAIDGVSGFSKTVYSHFFNFELEKAQNYLDGLLLSLIQDYKDIILKLDDLCGGKNQEDFDYSALEKVKAYLDNADNLYNGYTDKQKEAVKSEYERHQKYSKLYKDSFNYNVKNEYVKAVSVIEKYAQDSYSIAKGELDKIKGELENADKVYSKFIGEISDNEILALKAIYDKVNEKHALAVEKYELQEYYSNIQLLSRLFASGSLSGIVSNTVLDTADNDILNGVSAYVEMAQFLNKKDSAAYSNIEKIAQKVCEDLKKEMGDEYDAKNVAQIITDYISGGSVTSESAEKTFTIIPYYMSKYKAVSGIPVSISYAETSFTFTHVSQDGQFVLSSISRKSEDKTDTFAYEIFNKYEKVFTEKLLSSNFNSYTIDELAQIRSDADSVLNGIAKYDLKTINTLVGLTLNRAREVEGKCDDYSASKFYTLVFELKEDYSDREILPSEAKEFKKRCSVIDGAYDKLSQAAKSKTMVTDAVSMYSEVKEKMQSVIDLDAAKDFENSAVEFVLKYPDDKLTYEIKDVFTKELSALLDIYAELNEQAKAMQPAVNGFNMLTIISDKMNQVVDNHYYAVFVDTADKYLSPYYIDRDGTPQVISINIFDVSNVKNALSKVNNAYASLSDDFKNDSQVLYYMDVVSKLNDSINQLTSSPSFNEYSVEYPQGVTPQQVEEVMQRLDKIIGGELLDKILGKSLEDTVSDAISGALFKDETVSSIISTIYPVVKDAVKDYVSYLGLVGLYVVPKTVSERTAMNDYPLAQSILASAGDNWENVAWQQGAWTKADGTQVHDVVSFCDALGAGLQGINNALKALLTGEGLKALGLITIMDGNEGYDKDILPLLEILGCDTVSTKEFKANNNLASSMLKNILIPLLNRLDEILAGDTVTQIAEILPDFAYAASYDLFTKGVVDLASPLSKFGLDVKQVLLDNGIDLSDLISLANKFLGQTGITLPPLNWAQLAGSGEWHTDYPSHRLSGVRNHIEANKPDVMVQVVYYLAELMKANSDMFSSLISSSESIPAQLLPVIEGALNNVLESDGKTVAKALFTLLTPCETPDYDWSSLNWTKTNVKYPSGYSSKDVEELTKTLSKIVENVITVLAKGSLSDIVDSSLYSGNTVSAMFTALYSALADEKAATVLSLIKISDNQGGVYSIDVSKDAVSKALKGDYPAIAKAIDKASSITSAVISPSDWKVKDSESFAKAVSAVLSPFNQLLKALLAGQGMTVTIADGLEIKGANGYNNAVKPLLDALTCDSLTVTEYEKQSKKDSNNVICNIIAPVVKLADTVADDPVNAAVEIAPKAALFIDNGGVQRAVEQLLAPFNNLLTGVSMLVGTDNIYQWLCDSFLSDLAGEELKWNNLQNQLVPIINKKVLSNININGTKLSLKLPDVNWSVIAGCTVSKNGGVVKSDSAVQILKYLWKTVQSNKNSLLDLVKQKAGEDTYKTLSPYISKLLSVSGDKMIEVLIKLTQGLDSSSFKADWSFLYKNYASADVTYPQGVTNKDLQQIVEILSEAANNALTIFLDASLSGLINEKLYTNNTVSSIASAVYSMADNDTVLTVLNLFGSDMSKDGIAKSLKKDYPSISKSIASAKKVSAVNTSKWDWKVKDSESFAKAVTAVLRPLNNVLNVLLNSGEISIAGVVDFKGADGYSNAVKPLLDVLGCDSLSASKYVKAAKKNSDNLIVNILNPLLDRVDEIAKNPVKEVALILPQVSNFIDKGAVQKAVEYLLYPVTNFVSPLLNVITNDNIFDFVFDIAGIDLKWNNLQNEVVPFVNGLLSDGVQLGSKNVNLALPLINWKTLAGCGTLKNGTIKADTGKELMTILRYVFDVLKTNKSSVTALIGDNATVKAVIDNILKCGADGFTRIVVNILIKMQTFDNVLWTFKNIASTPVSYTANLKREDYAQAVDTADPLINGLVRDLAHSSIKNLVTDMLYTSDTVNSLAKLIYTNLSSIDIGVDINTVLRLLDVDISTKAVASAVGEYKSASKAFSNSSNWSKVNFDSIDWGFEKGDREGFVNALTAVLRPLYPVLRAVLSGEDLVVLGSIKIKGGNGYNTAILPIAEALGIDEKSLLSVKEYSANADTDKLITAIVNPILEKAEELLESPVSTLARTLPNLAYFVANGSFKKSVENLIAPVTNILKEIEPIYQVKLDLSILDNPDLAGMINSLISSVNINGQPLNIKLSPIDINALAGRGTVKTYTSLRTYNGERVTAKRVEADNPAVFISVLRYLITNLKTNLDAINALLSGLSIPSNILDVINQVLSALASEDVDSIIEMLMELLFGFSVGNASQQEKDNEIFDPFKLGNFYWAYWVFLAGITMIIAGVLYLLLKSKKSKNSDELLNDESEQEENL